MRKLPDGTGVFFWTLVMLVFWVLVVGIYFVCAEDEPDIKTYTQSPPSQTLPAGSIWNPIITEKKDGSTYKSYYQLPDSKVTPQGSYWNPLVTTKDKNKGK